MAARKKATKAKSAKAAVIDPRFARIAARLMADDRVSQARLFGATGLQLDGKVFAMVYRGALVVKLPAARVAALMDADKGAPFDPGHGRVMKEWIAVPPEQARLWGRLADEARTFVMAGS